MKLIVLLAICLLSVGAYAQDSDPLKEKIAAAMAAPERSEADRDRDRNRKPYETLAFFGMKDDMRVLELIPGGGWYTRILAPVLAARGELYVAVGTGRISDGLLKEPGFDKVRLLEPGVEFVRDGDLGTFSINAFDLDVEDLDLALTFRNQHNLTPDGRRFMNEAVFRALKSGGHYGVVDHTQRHMAPMTQETRRRMDPVLAIQEIQSVGFEFVGYSDLHYRPDDELRYEVGRKTVTGNTDRFTLLFRKP